MPNACEASHVRLSRFLHFVFEMTKQCFVIVMPSVCEASHVRLSRFLHCVFEMTKLRFVIVMPNACEASKIDCCRDPSLRIGMTLQNIIMSCRTHVRHLKILSRFFLPTVVRMTKAKHPCYLLTLLRIASSSKRFSLRFTFASRTMATRPDLTNCNTHCSAANSL